MTVRLARVTSDMSTAEMRSALGLVVRNYRAQYLTTHCDSRGRIRVDPESARRFRITCWSPADLDTALAAIKPTESRSIPSAPSAGAECAVWQFDCPDELSTIKSRLPGGEIVGDVLRSATYDAQRLEDVRWAVLRQPRGYVLELTYDANPHDEDRWRALCEQARQLLGALKATNIREPEDWTIAVERRSGHFAWSYRTKRSLTEQQLLLAETGTDWQLRDSDHYGDYLHFARSGPYAETSRVRVYEAEPGKFVIDLRWASERVGATIVPVEQWVLGQLLPLVGAEEIQEDEGWD
jgi:hypothetical protein